jgi:spore coat protein CotH
VGCAADGAAPSSERESPEEVARERPPGWDDASHGELDVARYDTVFDESVVHRIDIEMRADVRQEMLDDLKGLLGEPGMGGPGAGGPRGGFPQIPPELLTACEGKQASEACTTEADDGSCRALGGRLICLPANLGPGGGMGPGGGGALDLVGGDPIYVPVKVRYDEREWTEVSMRYKGNSSLASAWRQGILKLGFRLHFDRLEDEHPEIENQRFFGFSELTFSSGWNDASLIRDALAVELLRDAGLPAARTAFYRVYVDAGDGPVYWGLYTMIEDPSDALLASQFEKADGNLYKPDGEGADFTRFTEDGFDKKTNEAAADYSDVMAAIDALHADRSDASSWRRRLEQVFEVDVFLRTLAVSRAIGHWDSYGRMPHNYYLYADPARSNRLVWVSWDHNLTWQGQQGGFGGDVGVMMDDVDERWPLIRYLLDDPDYRATYREALQAGLEGAYAREPFEARASALHQRIAPYVLGQEAEPYTHLAGPDTFERALSGDTGLFAVAEQRREAVRSALAAED